MTLHNVVPACRSTAPVEGSDPPPTDAVLAPLPDWNIFGLTMTFADIQKVTHDCDSGLHARIKADPDFPLGFPLSDAPRARRLWWTCQIAAWFELRANKCKARISADLSVHSTDRSPNGGDDAGGVDTLKAAGAVTPQRALRRGGHTNTAGKRSAVRARRSEG